MAKVKHLENWKYAFLYIKCLVWGNRWKICSLPDVSECPKTHIVSPHKVVKNTRRTFKTEKRGNKFNGLPLLEETEQESGVVIHFETSVHLRIFDCIPPSASKKEHSTEQVGQIITLIFSKLEAITVHKAFLKKQANTTANRLVSLLPHNVLTVALLWQLILRF